MTGPCLAYLLTSNQRLCIVSAQVLGLQDAVQVPAEEQQ